MPGDALRCPRCGAEVREREEQVQMHNSDQSTVWLEPREYLIYSCVRCPWGRTVLLADGKGETADVG